MDEKSTVQSVLFRFYSVFYKDSSRDRNRKTN